MPSLVTRLKSKRYFPSTYLRTRKSMTFTKYCMQIGRSRTLRIVRLLEETRLHNSDQTVTLLHSHRPWTLAQVQVEFHQTSKNRAVVSSEAILDSDLSTMRTKWAALILQTTSIVRKSIREGRLNSELAIFQTSQVQTLTAVAEMTTLMTLNT